MYGKRWYKSKTIQGNIIAAISLFVANQFGYTLSPENQAFILTGLNVILRIITKEPLTT